MAIVLASTVLNLKKYDTLNILGLAGMIILLLNPLDVFNIGFVLSFTCMFSMALWATFSHKFMKFIVNKQIYSLLVASTLTSIGTLPCMAFYFGHFSLVSILTNVILLPIFTLTYAILFVVVLICLLIPIPFLLSIMDAILMTVLDLNKFFTFWEFDYIQILRLGLVGLIISFGLLYVASQKFNLKMKFKIPLIIFLIICVSFSAVYTSTSKLNENALIKINGEDNYCLVLNKDTTLINSFASASNLKLTKEFLRENAEYEIEYVYIFSFDFINQNSIESFTREFTVDTFFITEKAYSKFQIYFNLFDNPNICILKNEEDYFVNDVKFTFNDFGKNGYSLKFDFMENNHSFLFKK